MLNFWGGLGETMNVQNFGAVKNKYSSNNDFANKNIVPLRTTLPEASKIGSSPKLDKVELRQYSDVKNVEKTSPQKKQNEQHHEVEINIANIEADLKAATEQAESLKELMGILIRCFETSSNIISGKVVPLFDNKFLLENDPELHMLSVSAASPKNNPSKLAKVVKGKKQMMQEIVERLMMETSNANIASEELKSALQTSGIAAEK